MKKILSLALLLSGITFASVAQESPKKDGKGSISKVDMTKKSEEGKEVKGNKDRKISDKQRDTTGNVKAGRKGKVSKKQGQHCKTQKDSTGRVRKQENRAVEKKGIEKKDLKRTENKK